MSLTKVTRATTFIKDGWGAFNTLIDDLLSVANGKGASQVGIEDTAGNMSAANVEDALAEIYTDHATTKTLAETFDENPATTTGLVWGYKGGLFRLGSTVTTVSAGTIALTDDATNYIEIDPSDGLVKKNTSAFTSGRIPIREIITASGVQTTSTDKRAWFSQVAAATTITSGIVKLSTDAEAKAGTSDLVVLTPGNLEAVKPYLDLVGNLKLVVNATVNKLDIFTKTGGAVPDATDYFTVAIPDGNGYTARTRKASYLSGTSQLIMADATDYWGKGDLADEIKTAWVYAIWDGTGIVWALGGYSGFTVVPTTTTVSDDDYFLLEDGSTYTRSASHYCVTVAKVRYEYNTADTPDHTFQASGENAPQVIWNQKSDYAVTVTLLVTLSKGSDYDEEVLLAPVVKQSGKYAISAQSLFADAAAIATARLRVKTGSSTYASASYKVNYITNVSPVTIPAPISAFTSAYLNAGDSIHLSLSVFGSAGDGRFIYGDSNFPGVTAITFKRSD
jgi:hypothetical protein